MFTRLPLVLFHCHHLPAILEYNRDRRTTWHLRKDSKMKASTVNKNQLTSQDTISRTQIMGNSIGQMAQFLQQINCTEKRRKWGNLLRERDLNHTLTICIIWTLSEYWFEQSNCFFFLKKQDNQNNLNIVWIFDAIKELWLIFGIWHILVRFLQSLHIREIHWNIYGWNDVLAGIYFQAVWVSSWLNKHGHEMKGTWEYLRVYLMLDIFHNKEKLSLDSSEKTTNS